MDEVTSRDCTGCGRHKALTEFNRHRRGKYGRAAKCKECSRSQDRAYYEANRDSFLAKEAKYRAENPDKVRASQRRKYMKRREEIIAKSAEWAKNNPERRREISRKYQLRYAGLKKEQDFNPDYEAIIERDAGVCYLCLDPIEEGPHLDHIYPVSKGGAHGDFNIAAAHGTCNLTKNATLPEDLPEPQRTNALRKLEELKEKAPPKRGPSTA